MALRAHSAPRCVLYMHACVRVHCSFSLVAAVDIPAGAELVTDYRLAPWFVRTPDPRWRCGDAAAGSGAQVASASRGDAGSGGGGGNDGVASGGSEHERAVGVVSLPELFHVLPWETTTAVGASAAHMLSSSGGGAGAKKGG
eukprot:COSAG06_NODE_1607_length_8948_cov_3.854899_6_plen_142_part_00